MIFKEATRSLNRLLKKEKPNKFSSSWILYRNPDIYRFIVKNIRVETGGIDWDKVVSSLDRRYQKRWFPIHYRPNLKSLKLKQIFSTLILLARTIILRTSKKSFLKFIFSSLSDFK